MRALDQGVEDIEDGVAAPGIGVIAQEGGFGGFVVGGGGGVRAGDAVAIAAEGFKLVDELVYDIPGPEVLQKERYISREEREEVVLGDTLNILWVDPSLLVLRS